jgi:hypothetical protein
MGSAAFFWEFCLVFKKKHASIEGLLNCPRRANYLTEKPMSRIICAFPPPFLFGLPLRLDSLSVARAARVGFFSIGSDK